MFYKVKWKMRNFIKHIESEHRGERRMKYQLNKIALVVKTNTIVYPNAMMVHSDYTLVASTAMMNSFWFDIWALLTYFLIYFIS